MASANVVFGNALLIVDGNSRQANAVAVQRNMMPCRKVFFRILKIPSDHPGELWVATWVSLDSECVCVSGINRWNDQAMTEKKNDNQEAENEPVVVDLES
ncbi:MAG: hypothetical protein ACFFCK_07285, partial [Promethearchaeota archaeon]